MSRAWRSGTNSKACASDAAALLGRSSRGRYKRIERGELGNTALSQDKERMMTDHPVTLTIDTAGMSPAQVALLHERLTRRELNLHENVAEINARYGTLVGKDILDKTTEEGKLARRESNRANTEEI